MAMTFIFKPTSRCNLRCRYCFAHRNRDEERFMSDSEVLQSIEWAKQYAVLRKCRHVIWLWHGGEPMLLGAKRLQFLTQMVKAVFEKASISVVFHLQTNLTLLNQEWINVFQSDYCNTIGVSLDFQTGARVDATGKLYDDIVLRNILILRENNIEVNAISLVTPQNIGQVREMYDFFKHNELSFKTARYFPSTSPLVGELEYATTDEAYSDFLCLLYDTWVADKNPTIRVHNLLEMATGLINGRRRLCTAEIGKCYKNYLCLEAGGEIFNCGRYDTPQQRLGTINDSPETIIAIVNHRAETPLNHECTSCPCLQLCNGGCPFERETSGRYLDCFVTKSVLSHIATHLKKAGIQIKVDPTL